ncbi:MAG: FecCD family ABC transporter permease [Phycisphaerae bacterium]
MYVKSLTPRLLAGRLIAFAAVLIAAIAICSLFGSKALNPADVLAAPAENNSDSLIYFQIRLPRLILAAVVGACLSVSGAVFQALMKNPLADPYILGVSSGAGFGAVLAAMLGVGFSFAGISATGLFAFATALLTIRLVWVIGKYTGKNSITGLLLAGVVVNSFFSAIIMFLITATNSEKLHATLLWLMGNVKDARPGNIPAALIPFAIGFIILQAHAARLNMMTFGEVDARTGGVNTSRSRGICFACAAFITAAAVSVSGLIGFAGLIVPHTIRLVYGPDHRQLLPLSALCGAVFLVISDTIARCIIAPRQLPAGIITAVIGAPVFVWLLVKQSRKMSIYMR